MAKTPITQARDVTAQIALTSEEQETLRLWTDALQSAPEGLI